MSRIQVVIMVVWFAFGALLMGAWITEQLSEIGQPRVAYAR